MAKNQDESYAQKLWGAFQKSPYKNELIALYGGQQWILEKAAQLDATITAFTAAPSPSTKAALKEQVQIMLQKDGLETEEAKAIVTGIIIAPLAANEHRITIINLIDECISNAAITQRATTTVNVVQNVAEAAPAQEYDHKNTAREVDLIWAQKNKSEKEFNQILQDAIDNDLKVRGYGRSALEYALAEELKIDNQDPIQYMYNHKNSAQLKVNGKEWAEWALCHWGCDTPINATGKTLLQGLAESGRVINKTPVLEWLVDNRYSLPIDTALLHAIRQDIHDNEGRPAAQIALEKNATVTWCSSKSQPKDQPIIEAIKDLAKKTPIWKIDGQDPSVWHNKYEATKASDMLKGKMQADATQPTCVAPSTPPHKRQSPQTLLQADNSSISNTVLSNQKYFVR